MLITIVIMGVLVTVVLASLQVSVKSSAIDRDQAVAFAWLQAASDEIHNTNRIACTSNGQGRLDAIAAYNAAAQGAAPPPVWTSGGPTPTLLGSAKVRVVNVEYLGRANSDAKFEWGQTYCFEGTGFTTSPLFTQRVTIVATFPSGAYTRTLQMVKSER